MKQYLDLCEFILKNGSFKSDRTQTGTISYFGTNTRYNLENGLPILTTKKVNFHAVLHELLWFIAGDTNIEYLVKNNVKIWNEWPYANFQKSPDFRDETMEEFINKIKTNSVFAKKWGNLGPVYGKQWRNFGGVDQLSILINDIKHNPNSRRLILSAWNPAEVKNMMLPPCHAFIQFYVSENKELSCQLYQRSGDLFLGVPFNITSYSLLTIMIAKITGLKPKEFIHTIGDCHIYKNHIEQVKIQLHRKPKELPHLIIKTIPATIFDYKFEDFELVDYNPEPYIPAKVSV